MPTAEELAKMAGSYGSSIGGAIGSIWGPVGGMAGSALGSVGGSLIGSIPTLIKSDYEKENAKRLAELKRRQDLGILGFTEEEKQALYNAGTSATEKAAQDMRALQSVQAGALATGTGQAGIANALQQEQAVTARAALERDLQAKNLEEKRALQNEIEQRQALASEAKSRRQAAAVSVTESGLTSIAADLEHAKTVRGAKPTTDQLDAFSKMTGMDSKQISSVLDYMSGSTPEMQQLFGSLMKPGSTGAVPGYRGQ